MAKTPIGHVRLQGYIPGAIGRITELHAVYYHEQWGFDVSFETQVAQELSAFVMALNADRDGLWVANVDDRFAGSAAIDGRQAEDAGARLRWFIVASEFQGHGIGKMLLESALAFCRDRRFRRLFLWTFEGLVRARQLYEQHGFHLTEEHAVRQWGQAIREQKFECDLRP